MLQGFSFFYPKVNFVIEFIENNVSKWNYNNYFKINDCQCCEKVHTNYTWKIVICKVIMVESS